MHFLRYPTALLLMPIGILGPALSAQTDAEGCKDHPLFNRLPGFHIAKCEKAQFELKRFPISPVDPNKEGSKPKVMEVEGAFFFYRYEMEDESKKPSPLQTMRNFQNATRKAGGTVVAEYPGWCTAELDDTLHHGNGCTLYGVTMKFSSGGKETWAFVESDGQGEAYEVWVVEREAMKQDITVNQLQEKLEKDGFITLYINFETASAAIRPDSMPQLEQVAQMMKSAAGIRLEVAGHTDNVGSPESNLKLSDARAKSVSAALVKMGVSADRLMAKGYGQTVPVADNRTEEGRAKNRRVELVKK
ncbi:MAG: OmpA family protein [Acidobacteria bacterium]|nr:OmpA family protein [Acidobacteriota bacterium]